MRGGWSRGLLLRAAVGARGLDASRRAKLAAMHTPAFTHAGGICLRAGSAGPEVLCVRPSAPGEDVWLLPKGHIEPGEDAPEAGVREVAEEAGAKAANPRYVGSTSYRAKGEDVVCAFYRMDLVELGEGEEDRDVRWVPLSELEEAMPFPESVALVQLAVELG